jgi:hypothetical protein
VARKRKRIQNHIATVVAPCLLLASCYGGKHAAPEPQATPSKPFRSLKRAARVVDDCAVQPGQPLPAPLRAPYTGVAKAARCDREVYTIMGGVSHFLGVQCKHCHLEPDYQADTHNKQIANWMARELIPRLELREQVQSDGVASGVWCNDCHAGKAKFLGSPRRRDFAIDWMTTHLAEDFSTRAGKPPKCKDCHGGDLGSAEFRTKIILTELSGLPAPQAPAPAVAPAPLPEHGEP